MHTGASVGMGAAITVPGYAVTARCANAKTFTNSAIKRAIGAPCVIPSHQTVRVPATAVAWSGRPGSHSSHSILAAGV